MNKPDTNKQPQAANNLPDKFVFKFIDLTDEKQVEAEEHLQTIQVIDPETNEKIEMVYFYFD